MVQKQIKQVEQAKAKQTLTRPLRDSTSQSTLFDIEPDWREEWWGMPSFEMGDARPLHRVTVNFMTTEDLREFADKLNAQLTTSTDSMFYPQQETLRGEYEYHGPAADTRYPVYIPSKGRADCQRTGRALDQMGVSYKFVVESDEVAEYSKHVGSGRVLTLPFNNLGQGSIPARNWIWDHAASLGHKRHWIMDDNITSFARCTHNRRVCVRSGVLFRAIEDWVDRYENVAIAGPHHKGFVPDRDPNLAPFLLNSRVYSCSLIDTDAPYRWR